MEIYLTRHGQTELNKRRIIQGSGVDEPLNQEGHRQAELFWQKYNTINFDAVYCSQLKRTQQTLLKWETAGYVLNKNAAWNEMGWGEMEGQESTAETQKIFTEITHKWRQGKLDEAIAGGETPMQMQERQWLAIQQLEQNHAKQRILLCSHGRAMRGLLCLLTGQNYSRMDEWEHSNTCLYVLRKEKGPNFEVILKNDTSHLI